jgi:hypothetical protein
MYNWRNFYFFVTAAILNGLGGDYGVNATFSNISIISWQWFLLVEETRVPLIARVVVNPTPHDHDQGCQTQFRKEPTQGRPQVWRNVVQWFQREKNLMWKLTTYKGRTDERRNGRRRMPSDGKSSLGLWPGDLKTVVDIK